MAYQSDEGTRKEIQILSERYEKTGLPGLRLIILDRIRRQQPTGSTLYLLSDPLNRPVVGNISRWPQVEESDGWLNFNLNVRDRDEPGVHPARARTFRLTGDFKLLVGQDIYELKSAQRRVIIALGWGVILTLILGLAGGVFISRRMLTKIDIINDTTRQIMAGNLDHRVPVGANGDEFDQLSANLNSMLDQIQELMISIKQVSDNIAHDLKTPLFRLRQGLELLESSSNNVEFRKDALNNSISEADRLLGLFNGLLRIARIESETSNLSLTKVSLHDVVKDVIELYEPLSEEKRQQLELLIDSEPIINADRDMIFQALANLLDNAVKYTPVDGSIRLEIAASDKNAILKIIDSGPGIPIDEREKVFIRFHRIDSSRATPGNGLGLSLVRAVILAHKGSIKLFDNNPGLTIRILFPIN